MVQRRVRQSVLADAIGFVSVATKGDKDYGQFASLRDGWVIGYDGIVAAGVRSNVDSFHMAICPSIPVLKDVLARCGEPYSLVVLQDGALVVSGPNLRAVVPCIEPGRIPGAGPDNGSVAIDASLVTALLISGQLVSVSSPRILESAVCWHRDAVYGSNGGAIFRHNTTAVMPDVGVWIPAEFLVALKATKDKPTHVGFGRGTMTIWFGNDRWLRTGLYNNADFPDLDKLLTGICHKADYAGVDRMPDELTVALTAVKNFIVNNKIWLSPQGVTTDIDGLGASYNFAHTLRPGLYPYDDLAVAAKHALQFCYSDEFSALVWRSSQCMGALGKVTPWEEALKDTKKSTIAPAPPNSSGGSTAFPFTTN